MGFSLERPSNPLANDIVFNRVNSNYSDTHFLDIRDRLNTNYITPLSKNDNEGIAIETT